MVVMVCCAAYTRCATNVTKSETLNLMVGSCFACLNLMSRSRYRGAGVISDQDTIGSPRFKERTCLSVPDVEYKYTRLKVLSDGKLTVLFERKRLCDKTSC